MGLLTIIRKNRLKEKEMRLLFLGLDNAGKTTILKKLNGDVGGQRTLRPYWRNYFEQTDALVWVVDSGDRLRLGDCRKELHSLLLEDRLAGASLLVFANKQDIQGSMTDKEIEQASLGALDLPTIKSHQWSIIPCSAVTGYNLLEGLNWVVGEVASRLYYSTFTEGAAVPAVDKPPVVS
ncbi:ADP-ribosylation factor family-domain-containing protein [Russula compacta]|nr:ADP-ribosylation factor family-domain-containing protein [Russula compacta]